MPFVNNNGVKIHFEIEGNGPPLVYQHGLTSRIANWRENGYPADLSKENRLILVDARGHGKSDKPHDPELYRPADFAGDIIAILDNIGINKAGYWGYSMGGAIGFQGIAKYFLSRFDFLIIGGMSPYYTEIEQREYQSVIARNELAVEKGMAAVIALMEKNAGLTYTPAGRAHMLANDPLALMAAAQSLASWSEDAISLSRITVPCFLYAGEADGFCSGALRAAAKLPDARFVSFPGLNHSQVSRDSGLVLPHIRKFLAEVNRK
jgi:pimeloyl-ACP methyl ester carboxylesterase